MTLLALYVIFGVYFFVCIYCSVLAGVYLKRSDCLPDYSEDENEGTAKPDGDD